MDSPEFNEIMSALQGIVRRAYTLGRADALKRVIETMEKDEASWKPLAITGPVDSAPATAERHFDHAEPVPSHGGTAAKPASGGSSVPWYLRGQSAQVRKAAKG